jgi:hypothetical protein
MGYILLGKLIFVGGISAFAAFAWAAIVLLDKLTGSRM